MRPSLSVSLVIVMATEPGLGGLICLIPGLLDRRLALYARHRLGTYLHLPDDLIEFTGVSASGLEVRAPFPT